MYVCMYVCMCNIGAHIYIYIHTYTLYVYQAFGAPSTQKSRRCDVASIVPGCLLYS